MGNFAYGPKFEIKFKECFLIPHADAKSRLTFGYDDDPCDLVDF